MEELCKNCEERPQWEYSRIHLCIICENQIMDEMETTKGDEWTLEETGKSNRVCRFCFGVPEFFEVSDQVVFLCKKCLHHCRKYSKIEYTDLYMHSKSLDEIKIRESLLQNFANYRASLKKDFVNTRNSLTSFLQSATSQIEQTYSTRLISLKKQDNLFSQIIEKEIFQVKDHKKINSILVISDLNNSYFTQTLLNTSEFADKFNELLKMDLGDLLNK